MLPTQFVSSTHPTRPRHRDDRREGPRPDPAPSRLARAPRILRGVVALATGALLVAGPAACDDDGTGPDPGVERSWDFTRGAQGWEADFADYRIGNDLELRSGVEPLPEGVEAEGTGFLLEGTNTADDLFMYLREEVTGLEPSTTYAVQMEVTFATPEPTGCAGIGGSPGGSVYVKAGASTVEPLPVEEGEFWRMNVDKGGQSQGGDAAVVIGDVANTTTDCLETVWELKTLSTASGELRATTDETGALWLFVGTDSAFEGTTRLFYTRVAADLSVAPGSAGTS